MRKALFWEWLLGNPVVMAIIVLILIAAGVLWFMNERKEYEDSEKDRRNY